MAWVVYILECADNTFYTGITNDLERRFLQHQSGQGAKYTRHRGPLKIIYTEDSADRSAASKREIEIKRLTRQQKESLILKSVSSIV